MLIVTAVAFFFFFSGLVSRGLVPNIICHQTPLSVSVPARVRSQLNGGQQ